MADPKSETTSRRWFVSTANVEQAIGEKPLNGYFTTIMHLVKCYVGTGIFALGEGYKNSGLIFGTVTLIIIGIMNLNCQHILIKTLKRIAESEEQHVKPTFAETVEYTLEISRRSWLRSHSKRIGNITNIFVCLVEIGFCCVYFVFIEEHVLKIAIHHKILDNHPINKHIVLAAILLPMWASTFLGNLRLLLPLSIIANILIWMGIGIVFYYTTAEVMPPMSSRHMISPVQYWPLYFGTALYAFEGITFIVPLRNEMKNPDKFTSFFGVLNLGMLFVLTLFFLVGALGYWKYGDEVESSVFLNITDENDKLADLINGVMSVAVLFTFTLHMYIPFEITFPLFYRKYGPFKHSGCVVFLYRSVPVLMSYVVANVIPFLGLFISLIGATAGAFLALILPAILDLVAFQDELSVVCVMKDVVIIAFGLVGCITGTALSVYDIARQFMKEYG